MAGSRSTQAAQGTGDDSRGPLAATAAACPSRGRWRPSNERDVIRVANLEIRPAEYQLLADGRRVGLTVREFQTFLVLAERPDRVVTRPEIYARVWGGQMAYRDRSVDVFVRKVRRKLASRHRDGRTSTPISGWATASRRSG